MQKDQVKVGFMIRYSHWVPDSSGTLGLGVWEDREGVVTELGRYKAEVMVATGRKLGTITIMYEHINEVKDLVFGKPVKS